MPFQYQILRFRFSTFVFSIILMLLNIPCKVYSQGEYIDYFKSPVRYPIVLSGSFGELRSSHFHGGIDIKPSIPGAEGDTIISIGEGYISRIKVESGGYGKSILINHPNGLSSLYAHLRNFDQQIDSLVFESQKRTQNYDIEIIPSRDNFKIKDRQFIGNMGNTGFSYGPHLHLEIQETESGKKLNPKLFGIRPKDNIPPTFEEVSVMGMDNDYNVVDRRIYKTTKNKSGAYNTLHVNVPSEKVAISVACFDRMSGALNKNGIFELEVWVDGEILYHSKKDKIAPEDGKRYRFYTDYSYFKQSSKNLIKCFCLPGTKCEIVNYLKDDGIIILDENHHKNVVIIARDLNKNESQVKLQLKKAGEKTIDKPGKFIAKIKPEHKDTIIKFHDLKILWPAGTYSTEIALNIDTLYKNSYMIKPNDIALLNKPIVEVKIPEKWLGVKEKLCITNANGTVNEKQEVSGNYIRTPLRELGKITLMVDTISPTITPLAFTKKISGKNPLKFRIQDNVFCTVPNEKLVIQVYLDNEFIQAEYKEMDKTLYIPTKNISTGQHHLMIVATDHKKNVSTFKSVLNK